MFSGRSLSQKMCHMMVSGEDHLCNTNLICRSCIFLFFLLILTEMAFLLLLSFFLTDIKRFVVRWDVDQMFGFWLRVVCILYSLYITFIENKDIIVRLFILNILQPDKPMYNDANLCNVWDLVC